MGILIALFVLLFLLLLLSMPLIVEARAGVSLRGAVVHGRVFFLGLIPILVRLKLHFFSKPYFTLAFGKKSVSLLQKGGRPQLSGVRILRLDTKTTVGIEGEPAQAVLIAGAVAVLLSMLIPRVSESGSARANLSKSSMFRIAVSARGIVQPVLLLFGILRQRITRRKAANNTGKIHEKRTTYASC